MAKVEKTEQGSAGVGVTCKRGTGGAWLKTNQFNRGEASGLEGGGGGPAINVPWQVGGKKKQSGVARRDWENGGDFRQPYSKASKVEA